MPQSLLRRLVTTCTATARALLRTLVTIRQSAPAAPRAVDFAQETPQWLQTLATTCTATAPTSAAGSLTTSARRRVESAEENPFDISTIDDKTIARKNLRKFQTTTLHII